MKRFLILLLIASILLLGTGCGPVSNKGGINLSDSEISVELYDTYTLKASAVNISSAVFTWKSSDESVLTVEDGVITAKRIGEATVTASVGENSGSCKVTVVKNTYLPELSLRSKLEMAVDSSFTLKPTLRFKNEIVDRAEYEWESSNSAVASVSSGRVTAKSVGNAVITATTNAYGELLSASVDVTVKEDLTLILDEESITLYKPGTFTPDSHSASFTVYSPDGAHDGQVEWSSDDEAVATVDQNGLIKAVGKGSTLIKATGIFNDTELSAAMSIYVTVPVVNRKDIVFDFDSKTGDVSDLEETLGLGQHEKIERIFEHTSDGMVEYEYFAGNKSLVKSGTWEVGEKLWRVETSDSAYDIRSIVATRVLRTKEDILGMKRYNGTVMLEPEYYVLANDIDMEYADCPSLFINGDSTGASAWYGTFDGRGHKINRASFLTPWVATAGFFGSIGEKSVVKDLAFTNTAPDGAYGVFASFIFGRVENVYIDFNIAKIGSTARVTGLFAMEAKSTAVINNVIIKFGEFSLWAGRPQCAFINKVNTGAQISNVYALYKHATDSSLEKMFMEVATQAQIDYDTVKTLSSETLFKKEYCDGWDTEIWQLPSSDGKFPEFCNGGQK